LIHHLKQKKCAANGFGHLSSSLWKKQCPAALHSQKYTAITVSHEAYTKIASQNFQVRCLAVLPKCLLSGEKMRNIQQYLGYLSLNHAVP
jgi:hypothetical protein